MFLLGAATFQLTSSWEDRVLLMAIIVAANILGYEEACRGSE